jgi:predicted NACHT family NTPase
LNNGRWKKSVTYIQRRLWHETDQAGRQELAENDILSRSEPLIVLGEPGMGKSQLLRKLADVADLPSCTARQLINRRDPQSLLGDAPLILIDALDEVAAKREGDAVDLVLQKLGILGYPRFILSCRVADWQAATSIAGIREQYPDPALQLHLEPLGRDDQLAILQGRVGLHRAEKLLEHFEAYGLDFLGNPQTLDLIARLPDDRPLPASSGALFEQAIETLRVEHQPGKGTHELARQAALDAAGAAFAALILSGSAAIVRDGSANLVEGELHMADVEALESRND